MVTNINLSSPDITEKRTVSGKSSLMLSMFVLLLVLLAWAGIEMLNGRYTAKETEAKEQIIQEQKKASSAGASEVVDFQERLNLMEKAVDDHGYWDNMLVKISSYFLPEVKLTKFSGKQDASGSTVEISGVAPNLDAISRELILLKSFPDLDSLEFKNAGDSSSSGGAAAGISFNATIKINKSAFQK